MPISCLQTSLGYLLYIFYTPLIVWHYIFTVCEMFCLVVSQVLNRVYLIHRYPTRDSSTKLIPCMPLPGSSFWWVGPGEVLCNQMHHCVRRRKMSWESWEGSRKRERERRCMCEDRCHHSVQRGQSDRPWNGCRPLSWCLHYPQFLCLGLAWLITTTDSSILAKHDANQFFGDELVFLSVRFVVWSCFHCSRIFTCVFVWCFVSP